MDAVEIQDFLDSSTTLTIARGDYVEIFARDSDCGLNRDGHVLWLCRVAEFDQDQQYFSAEWLLTVPELFNGEQDTAIDRVRCPLNELFVYERPKYDWLPIGTIYRKVTIRVCRPGECGSGSDDYFVRFCYSPEFHSFTDLLETKRPSRPTVYRLLEIYSGAGGLSFLSGTDDGVTIEPCHAVDTDYDSLETYKLNHPQTSVHDMTVTQFLENCHLLRGAFQKYCTDEHHWTRPRMGPSNCNIVDMSVNSDGRMGVQLEMGPSNASYLALDAALAYGRVTEKDVRDYLIKKRHGRYLPLPGDVDIIAGGPPCQGLSRTNRHVNSSDVFACEKNREITVFMDAVEFFRPRFVVLENIPEAMSREKGLYYRYAVMRLLKLGYQIRTGILSAACYGAPQMRFRMFVIAALSGAEILPAFPHPTVSPPDREFQTRANCIPTIAKSCVVDLMPDCGATLHPPTLIWDAFEDLPLAENRGISESAEYRTPPERPYQLYVRRNEDRGDEFTVRAMKALEILHNDISALISDYRLSCSSYEDPDLALGERLTESSGPCKQKIWELHIADKSPEEITALERSCRNYLRCLGQHMCHIMAYCGEGCYRGPCMNHRCDPALANTEQRIGLIPPDGGDFTRLAGVVCTDDCDPQLPVSSCSVYGLRLLCGAHTWDTVGFSWDRFLVSSPQRSQIRFRSDLCLGVTSMPCQNSIPANKGATCSTVEICIFGVPQGWMIRALNSKRCSPRHVFGRLKKAGVYGTLLGTSIAQLCCPIIHPTQHRYITIREAARIQGFPDDYLFVAVEKATSSQQYTTKNIGSRFRMIGNAVSPVVANMLGKMLRRAIRRNKPEEQPIVFLHDEALDEAVRNATKGSYYSELRAEMSTIEADDVTDLSPDSEDDGHVEDSDAEMNETINLISSDDESMDLTNQH